MFLHQLSLTNNRLVDIKAIAKLKHLEFVNLLNNSLTSLTAFKDLKNLKWINISGNQIRVSSIYHPYFIKSGKTSNCFTCNISFQEFRGSRREHHARTYRCQ